jgi:PEGA domain
MAVSAFRAFSKLSSWTAVLAAALLCAALAGRCSAQAVVEAAGATSVAGSVGSASKPVFPKVTIPGAAGGSSGGASTHLIASSGPPPQETNVRDFQMHAGKDAGKVLLRAAPVEAQIWVNGKIVGKTPMLLVLAPGKYQVEMRGARGETGSSTVDLLPRETRELQVKLQQLYPGRVTFQK